MNTQTRDIQKVDGEAVHDLAGALQQLRLWVEQRDYAGHEPYDLLNSPYLSKVWICSTALSAFFIQIGRRFCGTRVRQLVRVPPSKNPKALGLFLAGYCDLARAGADVSDRIDYLRAELQRLASPLEHESSWGYDWNFVSLRGSVMPAFAPNSIATVFCAEALLDAADVLHDKRGEEIALSAARFCLTRLNRSLETTDEVCFSYTPENRTLIYNSSLLVGAFFARVGVRTGNSHLCELAQKAMRFVCSRQRSDGAWSYGSGKMQQWVDSFHTGYNLCALSAYRRRTGDRAFDDAIARGFNFYKNRCFSVAGIPKYFETQLYPMDIHACSQAVLTFCEFADEEPEALSFAKNVALWTVRNMRSPKGYFYYQKHQLFTNRTPYMRWAQAWMFRALARLLTQLQGNHR